jgi:hypothetical protein
MIKIDQPKNNGKFSLQPPLIILEDAREKLKNVKITNAIPESHRLRVKSRENPMFDMMDYDLFFDESITEDDMLYKCSDTEFILDNNTAYSLIGSKLMVDGDGEFEFKHFDALSYDGTTKQADTN